MSLEERQDSTIVLDVLSGKGGAFDVLVARYFETVRLVALAKTSNAADADDVAQETFLKAYTTLGTLRNRDRLAHWLVRIARNIAVSVVRCRIREEKHAGAAGPSLVVTPDHERREFYASVTVQVEELPVKLREVVLLHYFEGLKCREIAMRLNLSTNAVVKRLARGRAVLGDRLLKEWGGSTAQEKDRRSRERVMAAIAAIPLPDWESQLASSAVPGAHAVAKAWGVGKLMLAKMGVLEIAIGVLALLFVGYHVFPGAQGDQVLRTGRYEELSAKATSSDNGVLAQNDDRGRSPQRGVRNADGGFRASITTPVARDQVGFVAGTVVDVLGNPVSEATVHAVSYVRRSVSGSTTTDIRGAFRLQLMQSEDDSSTWHPREALRVWGKKAGVGRGELAEVKPGTTALRMELLNPAQITGQVVDGDTGEPVTEFHLRIDKPDREPDTQEHVNNRWKSFRSVDGIFTLEGRHGITRFRVAAPGYTGRVVNLAVKRGYRMDNQRITIVSGCTLRGAVFDRETGKPIRRARVVVRSDSDDTLVLKNHGVRTADDGTFSIGDLPRNESIAVYISGNGYAREIHEVVVSDATAPLNVYLGRGATARGRVIYDGGPPPGCQEVRKEDGYCFVRLSIAEDRRVYSVKGDVRSDGTFEVRGLVAGTYLANAFFWVDGGAHQEFSVGKVIEIRDGETTTLNIDYSVVGGEVRVVVSPDVDASELRVEICSVASPATALQELYYQNWDPVDFRNYQTLEPGRYLVRGYVPGGAGRKLEQEIQINAGETTEMYFDFSGQLNEPGDDIAVEE